MGIIWDHIRRTNTKRKTLPLIFPLVIFNGDRRYEHSLTLSDLLAPESVKVIFSQLFTKPFPLVDLAAMPDDTLREKAQTHVRAIALLMALKHAHDRNLKTFFEQVLVSALKQLEQQGGSDAVVDILYYLMTEGKFLKNNELKEIIHREFSQKTEGKLMTITQQIERKAKLEGKLEGKLEAMHLVANELLKEGRRIDYIQKITKLKRDDILALKEKLSH